MYREYVEHPESLSDAWREFFADYVPRETTGQIPIVSADGTPKAAPASASAAPAAPPASTPAPPAATQGTSALVLDGETPSVLRGASARIVENMEASLTVPTATSVRTVPAKLLEINRQILNNHLARTGGGKVSFTHIIGFAVLRALDKVPAMNSGYGVTDGQPSVVRHQHVNLGLAIDLTKSDGSRTLLVPNIKAADTLDFAQFHGAYEDLLRHVRDGKITTDDFVATTVSITNPGVIGTEHSVPRLMPGQGLIVGVGSIDYPPEYEGADLQTIANLGVSKVVALTSTYDHRVIQGAESGEFLAEVHRLARRRRTPSTTRSSRLRGSVRARALESRPFTDRRDPRVGREGPPGAAAHQHLPGARPPDREPRPARSQGTEDARRARSDALGPHDLGPRPRVPHRRARGPAHHGAARHPRPAPRRVRAHRRCRVHAHPGGRPEGVDPGAGRGRAARGHRGRARSDPRRRSTRPKRFERFLHTKYLGQKRFSLEGSETLIPMLHFLLDAAVDDDMEEAVIGMAHRGRLNVLTNVVGKSYAQVFREFEGELDPNVPGGSGDVKYHLGATGKYTRRARDARSR